MKTKIKFIALSLAIASSFGVAAVSNLNNNVAVCAMESTPNGADNNINNSASNNANNANNAKNNKEAPVEANKSYITLINKICQEMQKSVTMVKKMQKKIEVASELWFYDEKNKKPLPVPKNIRKLIVTEFAYGEEPLPLNINLSGLKTELLKLLENSPTELQKELTLLLEKMIKQILTINQNDSIKYINEHIYDLYLYIYKISNTVDGLYDDSNDKSSVTNVYYAEVLADLLKVLDDEGKFKLFNLPLDRFNIFGLHNTTKFYCKNDRSAFMNNLLDILQDLLQVLDYEPMGKMIDIFSCFVRIPYIVEFIPKLMDMFRGLYKLNVENILKLIDILYYLNGGYFFCYAYHIEGYKWIVSDEVCQFLQILVFDVKKDDRRSDFIDTVYKAIQNNGLSYAYVCKTIVDYIAKLNKN